MFERAADDTDRDAVIDVSGYAAPEANRSSRCAASRKSPLLTMSSARTPPGSYARSFASRPVQARLPARDFAPPFGESRVGCVRDSRPQRVPSAPPCCTRLR